MSTKVCIGTVKKLGERQSFQYKQINIHTLNHKKRDILFLTISLANFNRFLKFLYHFNHEEILHSTVVKNFSHHSIYLHNLPGKIITYILLWFMKCSSVHMTTTLSILTDFNNFCSDKTGKMYKTGHTLTYLLPVSYTHLTLPTIYSV